MMLTQLFLAAKQEGYAPLPYVRQLIHDGLLGTAAKLDTISPRLATKFLDAEFKDVTFRPLFTIRMEYAFRKTLPPFN